MNEESSGERSYTLDELEAVKKISKTKNYYEILGLAKNCSNEDIRKAFKELARMLHPDKNHAPGATEAMKSINKAFSVLNDPDAKKKYDEMPAELFDRYDYADDRFRQRSNNKYSFEFFLQMSPLFFMIMLSIFYYEDTYALKQDSKYSVEKQTRKFCLPFFVKADFKEKNSGFLRKIEKQVEEAHIVGLRKKCNQERNIKVNQLTRGKTNNNLKYIRELSSCEQLQILVSSY